MQKIRKKNLGSRRFALRRYGIIYEVFQFFSGLEERNFFCRHIYFFSGLGIASDAPTALAGAKTSEAANFDFVALLHRFDDALKNRFHDALSLFAGKCGHP